MFVQQYPKKKIENINFSYYKLHRAEAAVVKKK